MQKADHDLDAVFTDASAYGGAVVTTGISPQVLVWEWPHVVTSTSINFRELFAVYIAAVAYRFSPLHLVTDSQVVFHLLRRGWSSERLLNFLLLNIFLQKNSPFCLSWVRSEENIADQPSRRGASCALDFIHSDSVVQPPPKIQIVQTNVGLGGSQAVFLISPNRAEGLVPLAAKPKKPFEIDQCAMRETE